MIQGAGAGGGAVGRAAIDAALKQIRARAQELASGGSRPEESAGTSFTDELRATTANVDQEVRASDDLHVRALKGELEFHEVTAQLKRSEMTFEFALQVRNKLIDAYREVMRMSV